jgi:proteic killer suppression protein
MAERIRDLLTALDAAQTIDGMNSPSLRLHPLKGKLKGFWAVTIRANWRIIFRFRATPSTSILWIITRSFGNAYEKPLSPWPLGQSRS